VVLMPCYADTIVRIKYVKQNVKENSDLLVVWAIGAYPIEREDYDIELVLFVPVNSNDRDFETQAIFKKDNFFSVGGKIVPGYYNGNKRAKMTVSSSTQVTILKAAEFNKCPLKISLVGIPQEMPSEVKNDIIVRVLVTDYVGEECNFIVNVVFSCDNSRFAHVKDTIRPQESLVFVVGQMEIIDNEFYVSQSFSTSQNNIRSKLLATHQNISENSKDKLEREAISSISSGDFVYKSEPSCSHPLKRTRNDSLDNSVEDLVDVEQMGCESCNLESNNLVDSDQEEEIDRPVKKRVSRRKGKQSVN
ncbi:36572_t:CDS:2, partial [Racocetra persica]